MTDSRRALLNELLVVQHQPWNENRDLMTITGFMSDDEVRAHIARWNEPPRAYQMRCADCGAVIADNGSHTCQQQRAANRKAARQMVGR